VVAACAENTQQVKTVTVERQTATDEPQPPPRKKHRKAPERPAPSTPEFVHCDANIEAKADNTTCPFAQNVFWTYWTSGESGSPLEVWSPAAHASFTTTCEGSGAGVVCTTDDNAVVRFPQAAVDHYSQSQADAYGAAHDLGPDPYESLPDDDSSPDYGSEDDGSASDCQGYDPCIPPGGDVDCGGGSGNGPRYVDGPVDVYGSDPYGLDADGDGIGCDT
jgi:hypothetical protein